MNTVVSEIAAPRQDITAARASNKSDEISSNSISAFNDLIHELRQPLSTIDLLASFLEMTSCDDSVREHLQLIQTMASRAHCILDRLCTLAPVAHKAA